MRTTRPVNLKPKEQKMLEQLVRKGTGKARKITRARILLLANADKTDTHIMDVLQVARNTIREVRARYIKEGIDSAIAEKNRTGAPKKFSGRQEAKITAIACSNPPEGRNRWTLRLLADKVIEMEIAEDISHQTIKRVLKKTNLSLT